MPHYFFRIINDIDTEDSEGLELDSLASARHKAVAFARDLAAEAVRLGGVDLNHRIVVEDEAHDPMLTVTFRDAFTIKY